MRIIEKGAEKAHADDGRDQVEGMNKQRVVDKISIVQQRCEGENSIGHSSPSSELKLLSGGIRIRVRQC